MSSSCLDTAGTNIYIIWLLDELNKEIERVFT